MLTGVGLLLLAAVPGTRPLAAQEEARKEVADQAGPMPDFQRGQVRRPVESRPGAPQLPSELRLRAPSGTDPARESPSRSSSGAGGQKGSLEDRDKPRSGREISDPRQRGGDERGDDSTPAPMAGNDYADEARQAARWTARKLLEEKGWKQYLSAGVYEGLQRAVNSSSLGSWDYRDGLHQGQNDPEAMRYGRTSGEQTAEQWAREAAEAQVEQQFRDLDREPVHDPIIDPPRFSPSAGLAPEPQLDAVFADLPISSYSLWHRDLREAFRATGREPWQLFSASSYRSVFDEHWSSKERAFSLWKKDSSRSAVYRKLDDREDRRRFEAIFEYELRRQLASSQRDLQRAYEQGYAAGWDYGAAVSYEWQYRRGYTEGFNQVLSDEARQSFSSVYPTAYHRAYAEEFRYWSQSAHPDILELHLRDGNDDGIFEPGEELLADYTLVNYGGAAGEATVWLEGPDLQKPVSKRVAVPARSRQRSQRPVRATINPQARVRSLSLVDMKVGEGRRSADLLVSYPLELGLDPDRISLDIVNGRASFALEVVNRSRKPYPAVIDLVGVDGHALSERHELGSLAAGASTQTSFTLEQLRPADLLPGGLGVHFAAGTGSTVHDELMFTFPDAVRDLSSPDLVRYLLRLASRPAADPREVAALHDMMIQRLSLDWQVVEEGKGNPYKQDNKSDGQQTALGELIQGYLSHQGRLQSPEVIQDLRPKLLALAEELPGAHPLLRKHFRRLVEQLQ